MKTRKWVLGYHPTITSMVILPLDKNPKQNSISSVPLIKSSDTYKNAVKLIDEHNALVDKVKKLEEQLHMYGECDWDWKSPEINPGEFN